ncbi:hypothetical protein [Intestinibacillus massiliensis]|uniref:hypothetical protein n=1 Tax=Intestinibacillus massiliensis TaxID=1871029 RepID=UPI0013566353|nr:hypothetical protein [Intestinibacillus massiliensis]
MDMLVISKSASECGYKQMMIRSDTHAVLSQISKETGIPMTKLVNEMVRFCAERIEVED